MGQEQLKNCHKPPLNIKLNSLTRYIHVPVTRYIHVPVTSTRHKHHYHTKLKYTDATQTNTIKPPLDVAVFNHTIMHTQCLRLELFR